MSLIGPTYTGLLDDWNEPRRHQSGPRGSHTVRMGVGYEDRGPHRKEPELYDGPWFLRPEPEPEPMETEIER